MLYEFAMTPDLFDAAVINTDNAGTILVQLLRGIAENGLLADLHKNKWSSHITSRVNSLQPSIKDKVMTCLVKLRDRHRLVRHPRCMTGDPITDQDWLNLALESHDRIPFHAIFISQNLKEICTQNCESFVEFSQSLESTQWNASRTRTISLNKSPADYQNFLRSILRHAKSLVLIDPYINSQMSRYFDTITICSNVMGRRGHERLKGRIHIHAELKRQLPVGKTPLDYLDTWEEKLCPLVESDGHRFKVFLWESFPGSETMHDRYILTDQCGISVPGGLDCRTCSHPNRTDWSLLDEETRQLRWKDYDPVTSPFQLREAREIARII